MGLKDIKEYSVIKEKDVADLNSKGYLLKHKKSGARLFILSNDDDNKVFAIGFRTPPEDSTGTPHILEHSVLCGSEKFPVKDPFLELAKGSLNTFLNAMTYPDKTVYPVASVNEKDFQNLMDVYMDAVLHPNIYKKPEIFKQEGWRYEIENKEDDITLNGVVYNEMKGVFSSPDDVLGRSVFNSLFPDTQYANESGGDPDFIPDLTYENFIELHKKYYHPSNSYIYLYGDCDMEEKLRWLDEEYLSKFDQKEIDSDLRYQKPFEKPVELEFEYAISEDEEETENTYLSQNFVIGDSLDPKLYIGFQVLEYALLDVPGAPLMQTLLDKNLGKDIDCIYENGIKQPYFSIIAKNTEAGKKEEFLKTIREVLEDQVKNGIDKKALLAAINSKEFRYREADFGAYPKGLMYGLQAFDSWLYDDNEPFMHIEENETFAVLRKAVDEGYYEELIKKYLLNNPHSSVVVMKPSKTLAKKKEEATRKKLDDYKKSLSDSELEALIKNTADFKAYQALTDTDEDLDKLPMLKLEDIRKTIEPLNNEVMEKDGTKIIYHDIFTNGIAYLNILLDINDMPEDLSCYFGLMKNLYLMVDTDEHSYADLNNEINLESGGLNFATSVYTNHLKDNETGIYFSVRGKFLSDKLDYAFKVIPEVLFTSHFSDRKRLKELISMLKSRSTDSIVAAGHSSAVLRTKSYYSRSGSFSDKTGGIEFFDFVKDIEKNFDERYETLVKKFDEVQEYILRKAGLIVDFTGSKEDLEKVIKGSLELKMKLSDKEIGEPAVYSTEQKNEGIKTASMVQYVAKSGSFREKGLEYTGALAVLKVIMGYEYLWHNIREKGGAYGCMSAFSRDGEGYMASYRDPKLKETIDVFDQAYKYVSEFNADDRLMLKYIIGTVSNLDTPLTPVTKGARSLMHYMENNTEEELQKARDEVLSCDPEAIRALAPYLKAVTDANNLCVLGGEDRINENKDEFKNIRALV
ncbi:MAG: insulinase family protein [Lachnospiraceae bacterium]|nr:insulinase family protein [Lachnospiraceae bacterium]